ncbi:hypothetical protein PDJAM_G00069720 [Pangasius djambal]|uniref:Uncharacterized protein n=1 Tax=Pangasius djambal TaxID=1691987 RepID=A0ACC5YZQ1_9TELE|nr:hypothetical protein [Pangasius djambal]
MLCDTVVLYHHVTGLVNVSRAAEIVHRASFKALRVKVYTRTYTMSVPRKTFKTFHFQRQEKKYHEHCCAPLCTASGKFNSCLSFHSFPSQSGLRTRWIANIRRDKFTITSHRKVCSRHFPPEQLKEPKSTGGRRRLAKTAVPLLSEWNGCTIPTPRPSVWERRENQVEAISLKDHDYCAAPSTTPASAPATRALVRSGADVGMSRRSGVQSVFQFIPKVFSGVEVRALCRTLEFFHSNLHTPCLHGARFVHRGIVMQEQVWAS